MRGALIVFEGYEETGKTTQSQLLYNKLKVDKIPVELLRTPNRESATGQILNDYLKCKISLPIRAVNLIFAANRWEREEEILNMLLNGITVVVDRYAFSGTAYTMATDNRVSLATCKAFDTGLPKPDAVIYAKGESYHKNNEMDEIYDDNKKLWTKVEEILDSLMDKTWHVIDNKKNIQTLHEQIITVAKKAIDDVKDNTIDRLWV